MSLVGVACEEVKYSTLTPEFGPSGALGKKVLRVRQSAVSAVGRGTSLDNVLGRPIRYAKPSEDQFLAQLRADNFPADYVAVQKIIHRVVRLNISVFPNHSIRTLTGRPATTLRQCVADNTQAWR